MRDQKSRPEISGSESLNERREKGEEREVVVTGEDIIHIVVLIKFPDEMLQQVKKGKTSSEPEAYRIALQAIRALHLGSVRGDMTFISSTLG